jgi:energy-coupling factor transporter ATP-binding protein EcfA2
MRSPSGPGVAAGEVLLAVENVSLAFGGVKAVSDVSFDIRKGEIRAIIGPNGAGKTSMLNIINGFYQPQQGAITFKGETRAKMRPHDAADGGIARTFQNVALFRGMTALDNIMAGRTLKMHKNLFWQLLRYGPAMAEEVEHRRFVEDIIEFLEIQEIRKHAGGPAALRLAETGRTRPCARHGAGIAAARRADGRHEPRGERRYVALCARRERPFRHHHRADRARHGRGDGPVRPRRSARSRPSRSRTARPTRSRATRR